MRYTKLIVSILLVICLCACSSTQVKPSRAKVNQVDGNEYPVESETHTVKLKINLPETPNAK